MDIYLNGLNPHVVYTKVVAIASFLYILCGEILAHKIKSNPDIKGIQVYGHMNIISQFADDTGLFLSFDVGTLQGVTDTLTLIEHHTGLKVNSDKTSIYRIGSLANTDARLYMQKNFRWESHAFESLGITLSNNVNQSTLNNYSQIFLKIESTLSSWKTRGLTLMGKIMVVNSLIGSLFVYKMSVLENLTNELVKKYDKIIKEFL